VTFIFAKGDEVLLRARPEAGVGVITAVLVSSAEPQYEVFFGGGAKQTYSGRHLVLAEQTGAAADDPVAGAASGQASGAEAFRAFMSLVKLERPLADNLYSFAASRTERLPHQFKAVLKLLANPYSRLLIADEVGLGKTIEAGIILTELGARASLDHVLVACPSPLVEKWRREMRDRFLLDFEILDGRGFREFVRSDIDHVAPEPRRLIASLELMRRAENLDALAEHQPRLDVLIVDEAHHMRNLGTATNALGDVLTSLSETCIYLTATPLNLGRSDFYELMRLLVPEEFPDPDTFAAVIEPNRHLNLTLRHMRSTWPPAFREALEELRCVEQTSVHARFLRSPRYLRARSILQRGSSGEEVPRDELVRCQRELLELNTLSHVFTRTRKREVQTLFPTRRPQTVGVTFTEPERAFYDAVTDWVLDEYADRAAHLVVVTFQRLAASCLPALGRRLVEARRVGALNVTEDELAEVESTEAADSMVLPEPGEDGGLRLETSQSSLDALIAAWQRYQGRTDSKFGGFEHALRASFVEGADRILVFSYFTGTIDYLAERLQGMQIDGQDVEILKLYGPMNGDQREAAVERFRGTTRPVVLLSSEVGSEGLDFQFCSRMFNYDLPWNPMRVEQRIGRLDRYGQESDLIHILNMIVADTIEERIFYRLYERIEIFQSSIGDLEAILGEVEFDLAALQRDALSGRLTDKELDKRRNLIADVILRRQQEDEVFEAQSKQFLSNDDVFLDLFNDIKESRKYVTPDELRHLVELYLELACPAVRLEPGRNAGEFRLAGDIPTLRKRVMRALADDPQTARLTRSFVARLDDTGLDVTFDPQIATVKRRLEFISLHHPLIRAVAASTDVRASLQSSAHLVIDGLVSAPHSFFIYELQAHGLKDELELTAVVVRDGQVNAQASEQLLAQLEAATDVPSPAELRPDELQRDSEAARDWITAVVAGKEQELQAHSDEIISAQIESLRLTLDRRRLWLGQQIAEGRAPQIIRMRRAQLSRLETEAEAKVARLEQRRGITVGYRIVAAGIVTPSS
jgi:superfamily II DNA or RNA helicase